LDIDYLHPGDDPRRHPILSIDRPSVITGIPTLALLSSEIVNGSTLKVIPGPPHSKMTKHEGEKHENLDGAHLT
jgi:hypothetical protein